MNGMWCKAWWSLRLVGCLAILTLDLRTVALTQNGTQPHRCYNCGPGSTAHSEDCAVPVIVECPVDRPHCATVASTPNFTSSLVCMEAAEKQCSLTYSEVKQSYVIICVCSADLCNGPFSRELRQDLLNFVKNGGAGKNKTDFTDAFFNSKYSNLNKSLLYEALTTKINETTKVQLSETTTVLTTTVVHAKLVPEQSHSLNHQAPRAEALKQAAAAPSDDDEDEGEGSGAEDERRPAAAPAPSSYLPAKENKGTRTSISVLLSLHIFIKLIV